MLSWIRCFTKRIITIYYPNASRKLLTGLKRDLADEYPSSRKIETYLDIPAHPALQIDGYVYSGVLNGLRLCAKLYRPFLPFVPVQADVNQRHTKHLKGQKNICRVEKKKQFRKSHRYTLNIVCILLYMYTWCTLTYDAFTKLKHLSW